jgi:hypothetical protein
MNKSKQSIDSVQLGRRQHVSVELVQLIGVLVKLMRGIDSLVEVRVSKYASMQSTRLL